MSFLNPVSEPVLRFSSTDVDAPQINYNARVAGDIKTVLKGCLVTGYGAKASAGWSIVNEVDHVAEFVSPSVAMSDYRLGIDDASTANTTWYYQYQNSRVNPSNNTPIKNLSSANKTHVDNGWQLLVTARGLIFVELVRHTTINKLSARLTYFSQVKSALFDTVGANMMFFNYGHDSTLGLPQNLYSSSRTHMVLANQSSAQIFDATPFSTGTASYLLDVSNIDITSALYLTSSSKDLMLGSVPGLLQKVVNKTSSLYDITEQVVDARNTLSVCAGYAAANTTSTSYARTFLIYLDYWEY